MKDSIQPGVRSGMHVPGGSTNYLRLHSCDSQAVVSGALPINRSIDFIIRNFTSDLMLSHSTLRLILIGTFFVLAIDNGTFHLSVHKEREYIFHQNSLSREVVNFNDKFTR